jgi:DinB family
MSDEALREQILDTWRISHRINLYLLDSIPDEALDDVAPTKGRSVRKQLAHLHNVRLMWLKVAAPDLHDTQTNTTVACSSVCVERACDNGSAALGLGAVFATGTSRARNPRGQACAAADTEIVAALRRRSRG